MKLEDKFFNSFFYSFIICVTLSTIVVTVFLSIFSINNNLKTNENIINLEKKYSKMILKSVNVLLTKKFIKFQSSLNELILHYQKIANELLKSNSNKELKNDYLKCLLTIDEFFF